MADFDWTCDQEQQVSSQGEHSFVDKRGISHKFRWVNDAPLNDSHLELKVNFVEYWEEDKSKKVLYHNTWITDLRVSKESVFQITRGGRARWKIENETFNTLKNQGYHFEHNYGHGYKNLTTILGMLMMLAFLIDQSEQMCCGLFQGALKASHCIKKYLWEAIRSFFFTHIISSWKALYHAIMIGDARKRPILDSS